MTGLSSASLSRLSHASSDPYGPVSAEGEAPLCRTEGATDEHDPELVRDTCRCKRSSRREPVELRSEKLRRRRAFFGILERWCGVPEYASGFGAHSSSLTREPHRRLLTSTIRGDRMVQRSIEKTSRFKKVAVSAAAILVAAAATLSSAASASASLSECSSGSTCVWSGPNYATDWGTVGGFINFTWCIDDLGDYWSINNKTTSVFNQGRTETSYLYDGVNKTGSRITILRGTGKTDLNSVGFNDRASSGYFDSGLTKVGTATCN